MPPKNHTRKRNIRPTQIHTNLLDTPKTPWKSASRRPNENDSAARAKYDDTLPYSPQHSHTDIYTHTHTHTRQQRHSHKFSARTLRVIYYAVLSYYCILVVLLGRQYNSASACHHLLCDMLCGMCVRCDAMRWDRNTHSAYSGEQLYRIIYQRKKKKEKKEYKICLNYLSSLTIRQFRYRIQNVQCQ